LSSLLIAVPAPLWTVLEQSLFGRAVRLRTLAAPDPREVVRVARTLAPDAIVAHADGYPDELLQQMLAELREDGATADSAIILLTADPQRARRLEQAGADFALDASSLSRMGAETRTRLAELLALRQRRSRRGSVDLQVDATIAGPEERSMPARALNVGMGGMLLDLPEPLAVGAHLDLAFRPGPHGGAIRVEGTIVRTAETADGRRLAGVHFTLVTKAARFALREALREMP
jgi:hypothetical protein